MAQTVALARIHRHEATYRGEIHLRQFDEAIGLPKAIILDNCLEAAILRARKKQKGTRIQPASRNHGGKGVEIRIGMAGDNRGNGTGGVHSWLRG